MVATKDGGTTKGAANGCDDNEGGDGSTMEATGGLDPLGRHAECQVPTVLMTRFTLMCPIYGNLYVL